jgi:hypothetical protein
MADPKLEVPLYDVKSPLNLEKWNPVVDEVPTIAREKQKALDAQEEFAKSLEDRYAQPNWFKIAAGFAKPQLGGFMASLGSASEALGQGVEQQRAIAPTIARMRSEVAQGRISLETNKEQQRAINDYDTKGVPDINELRRIYSINPNSDVGKSIEKRPEFETSRRAETGFNVDLQEKLLKQPSIIINDPNYKNLPTSPEKSAEFVKNVNATRPPGTTPAEWNAMSFESKKDAIATYANNKIKENMSEGQKFALDAGNAHDILDELTGIRQLAIDPKLAPIFSNFKNGDIFSQIRAYMNQNPGSGNQAIEGIVATVMQTLKNESPETRAKADKLIKDIAALEVRLRGSLNNPTDAASILSAARSPSLDNSQYGFVGILDQLALNANRDIGISKLHNTLGKQGLNAKDAAYSAELENYRMQTRELRRQYATQYPSDQFPEWYGLKPPAKAPEKEPTKPATNATNQAPVNSAPQPSSNSKDRPNERIINGQVWVRQPDGSYKPKE